MFPHALASLGPWTWNGLSIDIYHHWQGSDALTQKPINAYPLGSYVFSWVVQQKLMACTKCAEWLFVDGAGLFRRENDLQVYQLWICCEQFQIINSCGCFMCEMQFGRERCLWFQWIQKVSVRFYTSMLAGKVSKSADSYTLQVQHLRVKMWSKMRRNPKFQCRADFRCFDSLEFAVLWSSPFLSLFLHMFIHLMPSRLFFQTRFMHRMHPRMHLILILGDTCL